jgi:hypothetical protein
MYLLEIFFKEFRLHRKESVKVLRSYLNILLFDLEHLYDPLGFVVNKSAKQQKVKEFEKLIERILNLKKCLPLMQICLT